MPQRAETTKDIFQKDNKGLPPVKNKKPFFSKWSLLFSVLFSIIAGGLAGYLASNYWLVNQNPEPTGINLNTNQIVDFTKKITVSNPTTEVINKLAKQIVGIYSVKKGEDWWQKLYLDNEFLGTGLVITSDGWLMTTSDVIPDFKKDYQIMTANNNYYLAKDFIQDKLTGVVFFKIDAQNLSPVQFADLEQITVAQSAVALAADNDMNDLKVKISNLEKLSYYLQKSIKDYFHSTEKQEEYFLLKDSLPTNFASCLVANNQGEVIGLGSNLNKTENFQTIIPTGYLAQAVKQFLINKTEVKRNYLGLTYLDLSQNPNLPANLTANRENGALIIGNKELNLVAIKKDSPAKNILMENDIVLKVNDDEINNRNNFTMLIQNYPTDSKIKLLILRQGEEKEVEVTLK